MFTITVTIASAVTVTIYCLLEFTVILAVTRAAAASIATRMALLMLPLPPWLPPAAPTALAIADSAAVIDLFRKRGTAHAKSAIQEAVKSAVPQVSSFAR